jgi:UDP-N-acetylmuramyl tripeptide synthase
VSAELRASFPNDEELYGTTVQVSQLPAQAELMALPGSAGDPTVLRIGDRTESFVLRAAGPHNAQNAAGAAAMAMSFGLSADEIAAGLAKIEPAFGRGQSFSVDGRNVVLHLVKNPAGFRQSLRVLDTSDPAAIVIVINDDYADGRDVSWLWDVPFTVLQDHAARLSTSGTRAADMAVRLRYDDVEVGEVEPDLERALAQAVAAVAPGADVAVFSTYTAMWSLHATLVRIGVPA